jgi:hypothetical protein
MIYQQRFHQRTERPVVDLGGRLTANIVSVGS